MSTLVHVLLPNVSRLAHTFEAVHEKLGSDGHDGDGDYDGTKANPRACLRFRLSELTLFFLESVGCVWMEFESIVLAGWVRQEDARADITEVMVSVGYSTVTQIPT